MYILLILLLILNCYLIYQLTLINDVVYSTYIINRSIQITLSTNRNKKVKKLEKVDIPDFIKEKGE